MIDKKELRIGNFVLSDSKLLIIEEITRNGCCAFNGDVTFRGTYEDLEPIPLDESILLKCGFKLVEGYGYVDKYGIILAKDNVGFYHINNVFNTHIDHVHTLQNWYFANTKEELNITL